MEGTERLKVVRYSSKFESDWNEFLPSAKNQTFLFDRKFMDYHADRFSDHSIMVFDGNSLIACFPANEIDNRVISHSGLTYGGLILKNDLKLPVILAVFRGLLKYYHESGISQIVYKSIPRIYNWLPADEVDYALFLIRAELIRRDTAIVIPQESPIGYAGNLRREAKKARDGGYEITEDDGAWKIFWDDILEPNLLGKFNRRPVHSLEEILLLKNKFPEQIRLFVCREPGSRNVVAGTVLFVTHSVVHCQYISSSETGRRSGALNLLFVELIDRYFKSKRFFDLGIVNENEGRSLNQGLLAWKERLGGRTIVHDFYRFSSDAFSLLDDFIL